MHSNIKIISIYLFATFLFSLYFLGFENLFSIEQNWINEKDQTADFVSWYYFKNDIWRFPLGSNPNYGMGIGSGIVFSGSIPLLAIIFKIFSGILPENFHYFTFWIYLCFFLQAYIAYLIIYHQTKNLNYAIIGSIFFLVSPAFISRITMHLALAAHWLILLGYYLEINKNIIQKRRYWIMLICMSALIHFYFTIILFGMYFLFLINRYFIDFSIKNLILETFYPFIFLALTMYITGFFHVPVTDALGFGYGYFKLNLNSIFNPFYRGVGYNANWSLFLPTLPSWSWGEFEGFNYLGLSGILIFIFLIFYLILNFKKLIIKNNLAYILIIVLFSLFALTNNVSFSGKTLLAFELPKIIYGIGSIGRASGRFFWPVNYLIILFGIFLIHKILPNKKSIYILSTLLILQLIDLSPGLKKINFNNNINKNNSNKIDEKFWLKLSKEKTVLRTTHIKNETNLLRPLKNVLLNQYFKKTDISRHGRFNRKEASIVRSKLYNSFNKLIIDKDTVFVADNLNHLRNIKHLFKNQNIGFFYKSGAWIIVDEKKNEMTKKDIAALTKLDPIKLKVNKEFVLNYGNENSIHGFGWTNNYDGVGIWSEGNISTLLFKIDNPENKKYLLNLNLKSLSTNNNEPIRFIVEINYDKEIKYELSNLVEISNNSIKLELPQNSKDNSYIVNFKIKNPITPLQKFESPDARRLGFLLKSVKLMNIN